jgi:hypothetical protein
MSEEFVTCGHRINKVDESTPEKQASLKYCICGELRISGNGFYNYFDTYEEAEGWLLSVAESSK